MAVDYAEAARAAARRYCGWIVTPPETVTVTVEGDGRVLSLPSLHVAEVTAVVEDGATLDLADLRVSQSKGSIRKRSGQVWCGDVEVTMTHGLGEAVDFDAAVEAATAALASAGTRTDMALKRKKVDDTEYEWFEQASTFLNTSLLDPYRILPAP